jgi:hypothetical protein
LDRLFEPLIDSWPKTWPQRLALGPWRRGSRVESKNAKGQVQEVRQQQYSETVALPAGIDMDKVEAKYRNGVLTVTQPRTAEGKARWRKSIRPRRRAAGRRRHQRPAGQ